jgi:hypothetical protein
MIKASKQATTLDKARESVIAGTKVRELDNRGYYRTAFPQTLIYNAQLSWTLSISDL